MLRSDEVRDVVERARGNDPDAWEALYRHAYPKLHTYVRRRIADQGRIDDLIHEAFIRAMDGIERFVLGASGVDGWLFGITRNVIYEHYRGTEREAPIGLDDVAPLLADIDHLPANQIIRQEEAEHLRRAFARLDPDEQELLELRVIGELDAVSVAHVVDRTPGSVRTAQSRALVRLRTFMTEETR